MRAYITTKLLDLGWIPLFENVFKEGAFSSGRISKPGLVQVESSFDKQVITEKSMFSLVLDIVKDLWRNVNRTWD